MATKRAFIEVAPLDGYVGGAVLQDDVIVRAENALQALHIGTACNLPVRVAGSNVNVTGTLTVNGVDVTGNPADLLVSALGFGSNAVTYPTSTKILAVGGRVVGNQLRLVAGNGNAATALRTATARRTQYLLSNLYPTVWASSAQYSMPLQ